MILISRTSHLLTLKVGQLSLKIVIIGISVVLLAGTLFPIHGLTNTIKTIDRHKININQSESTVTVGDINIAYKIFGKGDPLVLISGLAGSMDSWDPLLIERLASNYSVIAFNNRGVGNTTSGQESFSIKQFAIDTFGLLDVLNISKAHVLGHSMGGMIALELALMQPERVSKLIISASFCGKSESIPNYIDRQKIQSNWSGSPQERIEKLVPFLFPNEWRERNLNSLNISMTARELSNRYMERTISRYF